MSRADSYERRREVCLSILLLWAGALYAQGDNTVALPPDADSYIRRGDPGRNFGNSGSLVIKDGDPTYDRDAYMRFDLSTIAVSRVVGVALTLTVSGNNRGTSSATASHTVYVYGLKDSVYQDDWVEGNGGTDGIPAGEITWNNAPANNRGNAGFTSDAEYLGSFSVTRSDGPGAVKRFAPGEALLAFLQADTDGMVSILLKRNYSGYNLGFASRESTTWAGPRLELTYSSEPYPFVRGDPDGTGEPDMADALALLETLFVPGSRFLSCETAADLNDSGDLDVTDAVHLLRFLYSGGSPPLSPYPDCDTDPTVDDLLCIRYAPCESEPDG